MTTKKTFIWILASLCTLIITSCNSNNSSKIDREKLSQALAKYDSFTGFSDGLAKVQKGGKYGFIDKDGNEKVSCIYDDVDLNCFSEGLAAVKKNEKWGFIDKSGKEIIPCTYNIASCFSEGLVAVEKDGKYGYVDKTGQEVIPCIHYYARDFSNGLAAITKDYKDGYIDKTGKEVIPCIYDSYVPSFSEGLAAVSKARKYGYIDKIGKEVIPCIYDRAESFSDGLAAIALWKNDSNRYQYEHYGYYSGYIDKTGKGVIPPIYDFAGKFSEGLAYVNNDEFRGYIDKTGKQVISCNQYYGKTIFSPFSNGLAIVNNDKFGYIDKTGKEAIPLMFESANSFSDGLAKVKWNGQEGFIDKEGYFIGKGIVEKIYMTEKEKEEKNNNAVESKKNNTTDQSHSNPNSEQSKAPSPAKNNLITIRLEAIVNSNANGRKGVSNIKCNYGDSDYRIYGGMNLNDNKGQYLGEIFSSGYITVPSGKSWIYKDVKLIKEAPSSYKSDAIIAKKNGVFIRLNDSGFTGITLNEGNVFRVFCTAMDYENRVRQVPDGSIVGLEFTFIEIAY